MAGGRVFGGRRDKKDYNKWYIDVVVTTWLQPPTVLGLDDNDDDDDDDGQDKNGMVVRVLAYVLMDNQFHLVTRRGPRLLGRAMHRLLTGHSIRFNRRHARQIKVLFGELKNSDGLFALDCGKPLEEVIERTSHCQ